MYLAALRDIDVMYKSFMQLDKVTQTHLFKQQNNMRSDASWIAGRYLLAQLLNTKELPEIVCTSSKNGKPEFVDDRFPFFNMSHSGNKICVVISDKKIGCDIEKIRDRKNYQRIAREVFQDELASPECLDSLTIEAFWTIWVKKEAMLKYQAKTVWDMPKISLRNRRTCVNLQYFQCNDVALAICGESDSSVEWK